MKNTAIEFFKGYEFSWALEIGDLKKEEVALTTREGKLRDDLNHKYPHAELIAAIEQMGFSASGGQTIVLPEETDPAE